MLTFIGKHISQKHIHHPIFIVGTGRSGTSILLQALGAHPSIIAFPGESPFLTSIGGAATLFNGTEQNYYRNAIRLSHPAMMRKLRELGFEASGGEFYALKNTLKHRYRHRQFARNTVRYWAAKTFPTELVSDGLDAVYPGAKYLYIVRNGIEVVHSMTKFHGFKDNDFTSHCQTWAASAEKYEYLQTRPNALMIKHELLSQDPDSLFSEIHEFLALTDKGESAGFTKTNVIHPLDKTDVHTDNNQELLSRRGSPTALWGKQQRAIFLDICAYQMQRLGYDCDL
jgi:hypothetical protein